MTIKEELIKQLEKNMQSPELFMDPKAICKQLIAYIDSKGWKGPVSKNLDDLKILAEYLRQYVYICQENNLVETQICVFTSMTNMIWNAMADRCDDNIDTWENIKMGLETRLNQEF